MNQFAIHSVYIENFRQIAQHSVDFEQQMTVIVDIPRDVLEALRILLGSYLSAYQKYIPARSIPMIICSDRQEQTFSIIAGDLQIDTEAVTITRIKSKRGSNHGIIPARLLKMGKSIESAIAKADHSDAEIILPLVLYTDYNQLEYNKKSKKIYKGVPGRLEVYKDGLKPEHTLNFVYDYIKKLEYVAMEENDGKPFPAYAQLLKAMNQAFLAIAGDHDSIVFSQKYAPEILAIKSGTDIYQLSKIQSQGICHILNLILDIAVRMCILNPYLKDDSLEQTPGVVLLANMPAKVESILQKIFPKIQFICSVEN